MSAPAPVDVRTAPRSPAGQLVAVTAWSTYLPGVDPDAPGADRAKVVLGRKGLLFKEPATRLALCAVHRALGLADGDPAVPAGVDPRVAVVASANLGNVGTVDEVVRATRTGGRRDVSPLAAPNASSNVLASTVAIWFGFGGPNLMVCSGATGGLDAIGLGARLLRADRADRVVVIGAEPDDEVATALHAGPAAEGAGGPLLAGAACVILEPADAPGARGRLGPVTSPADASGPAVLGPDGPLPDPYASRGDSYGALGVRLVATAGEALRHGGPLRIVCGDHRDGFREVTLWAA